MMVFCTIKSAHAIAKKQEQEQQQHTATLDPAKRSPNRKEGNPFFLSSSSPPTIVNKVLLPPSPFFACLSPERS